jgi:hypothetical protein
MSNYRVHLHSKPGMWTFYSGYVDVMAFDQAEAVTVAIRKLRRTSFQDRPLDSWVLEYVEDR